MAFLLYLLISTTLIGIILLFAMTAGVWMARSKRHWQRYRTRTFPLQVVQRTDFTDNLFEIELIGSAPRVFRQYLPGQFISLQGPLLPSGVPMERRYSLANWEAKPRSYRLCVKREPQGKMSNWLHEHAKPGSTLLVRPPAGEFHLRQTNLQSPDIVLVGAGVGITPLKAMIEWLEHQGYQGKVTLFYTARHRMELLYHQQFIALTKQWPNFEYLPHLTGQEKHSLEDTLTNGRITADGLFQRGGLTGDYYFCASQAMIDSLIETLQRLGVNVSQLHYELFAIGGSGCGSFEVRCGDKAINAEGFPSLLHVLEAMDVPVDTDCRAGTCGRCRVTLESGTLRHTIVVPKELALPENQFLACCAVPETPVDIEVQQ